MHIWVAVGLLGCWGLLAWQSKKTLPALGATLLSMALGLVAGRLAYVLLLPGTLSRYGVEVIFRLDESKFSLFGAAAGAVGGAVWSARFLRVKAYTMLNWFAPCGAWLLGCLRVGEKAFGTLGAGEFMNAESFFARFPFAVQNAYGEHLFAVFYLEALCAFACAAMFWKASHRAEKTAFTLALLQIFCESLRARCMRWGFVRVEQLLCALLVLALLGLACKKRQSAKKTRYLPLVIGFLCIVCVGLLEYALDKTGIPVSMCYLLMGGALAVIGAMDMRLIAKRAY